MGWSKEINWLEEGKRWAGVKKEMGWRKGRDGLTEGKRWA